MSTPTRPIPDGQRQAFHLAVCERLGIDPAIVAESGFRVEWNGEDELGHVHLTAVLPRDELTAMFNAAGR